MPQPVINPGNVVQVIQRQELAGQVVLNTAYYRYEGAGALVNGDTACAALGGEINNAFAAGGNWAYQARQIQSDAIEHVSVQVQIVHPTRYAPVLQMINQFGAVASAPLPVNCALSISRGIQLAGRGFTGHMQFAGVPYANTLDSMFDAATVLAWGPVGLAIKYTFNPLAAFGKWVPVLFGKHAGVVSIQEITRAIVKREVRTMHRRTVGLGI